MAMASQTYAKVEDYVVQLRGSLRAAASEGLAPLRSTMQEMGYDWLDGYLEGVVGSSSRAPITELMKTPSRTATTKKTRATTAAAKDRTEKVKGLNARLGVLSPSPRLLSSSNKGSPAGRQPLSPLQPRSLNAPLPPQPIFSPSPLKPPAAKGKAKEKEKGKGKAVKTKKGKGKKVDEGSVGVASPPSKTSSRNTKTAQAVDAPPKAVVPALSSQEAEAPDEPDELDTLTTRPSEAEPTAVDDARPSQAPTFTTDSREPRSASSVQTQASVRALGEDEHDLAGPAHLDAHSVQEVSMAETSTRPLTSYELAPAVEPAIPQPIRQLDLSIIAEESSRIDSTSASASIDRLAVGAQKSSLSLAPAGRPVEASTQESTAIQSTQSAVPSSAPPAPGPSVPVRQVRSSWLSKALGTDTVPVSHTSDLRRSFAAGAELRKSFAPIGDNRKSFAPSAMRPNTPSDLTTARKSLAPVNGLKRKSDVGAEDETLHVARPEKVARFDEQAQQAVITPMSEEYHDFPIPLASSPRATASLPRVTPGTSEHSRGERGRSDIHKVSRALDELREKAQAKEAAAKAKAAAAAHAQKMAMYEPKAQSTGSGFLRGLGNSLGRSLGFGNARSAEEEARQREEDELAEQQAKEELERLMAGSPASVKEHIVHELGKSAPPSPSRQSVHTIHHPEVSAVAEPDQLDEDEEMDESQVIDELNDHDHAQAPRPVNSDNQPRPVSPASKPRSTTPTDTPPRAPHPVTEAPPLHSRVEKHVHAEAAKVPKPSAQEEQPASQRTEEAQLIRPPPALQRSETPVVQENARWAGAGMEIEEDELDEEEEEEEEEKIKEQSRKNERRADQGKASFAPTSLSASTTSQATTAGYFGQASTMANKALGVKPSAGPVKSIQLAAAAAKKELEAADRKALLKEQAEQRRIEAARKKAEEDRTRAEEERKAKLAEAEERRARQAEIDEKRRQRLEAEKKRKEKEDRIAKEKAAKEAEERAIAKAKAEEEANKKRKLAPQLNKSANGSAMNPAKRVAAPAGAMAVIKPKEAFRPNKAPTAAPSGTKLGPSAFRTATVVSSEVSVTQTQASTSTSTISLVPQAQGERRPLGPPSRASHQPMVPTNTIRPVVAGHAQAAASASAASSATAPQPAAVLQAQRLALKTQIDEVQSEDIVLPDIASEYSNSDDESEASPEFKRPSWAESPALRAALEAQATRNPDDLFGEIKPVSMEELFKVRQGKFRARTSSANWGGGDRLTRVEEIEYARRMGFGRAEGGAS